MTWVGTGAIAGLVVCALGGPALAADPATVASPVHRVGDTWVEDRQVQRGTNGFSDQQYSFRIESVASDTMVVGIKRNGAPGDYEDHISGVDLSQRRVIDGQETITGRPYVFPLSIGKTWTADYTNPNRFGRQISAHFHDDWRAVGWEDVTTPAGVFHCVRVEGHGRIEAKLLPAASAVAAGYGSPGDVTTINHVATSGPQTVYHLQTEVFDYSPELGVTVKSVEDEFDSENIRTGHKTNTLLSFQHGG